jgi:hypothetical protein
MKLGYGDEKEDVRGLWAERIAFRVMPSADPSLPTPQRATPARCGDPGSFGMTPQGLGHWQIQKVPAIPASERTALAFKSDALPSGNCHHLRNSINDGREHF